MLPFESLVKCKMYPESTPGGVACASGPRLGTRLPSAAGSARSPGAAQSKTGAGGGCSPHREGGEGEGVGARVE